MVSFAYAWGKLNIFILLSIKTRIETRDLGLGTFNQMQFLSYYPLKQGLKLVSPVAVIAVALYFYPTIH